jgi:hypothetical protein
MIKLRTLQCLACFVQLAAEALLLFAIEPLLLAHGGAIVSQIAVAVNGQPPVCRRGERQFTLKL